MEYFRIYTRTALSRGLQVLGMLLVWSFFSSLCLAQSLPQPASMSYHRTFQGTIHTYPITMNVVISQNEVNGYYYYDRVRDPLYFSGTVRSDGTMNLAVNDPNEYDKTIESFVGRISSDNAITGTWVMLKNNKKLAFSVKEIASSSASITFRYYEFERCNRDTDDKSCVTANISIPEINSANTLLSNNMMRDIKEHLCEDAYMKTAECFLKTLPDLSESGVNNNYDLSVSVYIFLNQLGILSSSIEKRLEWDQPRPISETTTRFMNYSIKTGQKISSRDMFMSGTLPYIENLIKSKIRAYVKQDLEENYGGGELYYDDLDKFNLDTSISIAPYALIYHYPFYHSSGNGYTEIMIPYDEIKRWINPNGPLGFVK